MAKRTARPGSEFEPKKITGNILDKKTAPNTLDTARYPDLEKLSRTVLDEHEHLGMYRPSPEEIEDKKEWKPGHGHKKNWPGKSKDYARRNPTGKSSEQLRKFAQGAYSEGKKPALVMYLGRAGEYGYVWYSDSKHHITIKPHGNYWKAVAVLGNRHIDIYGKSAKDALARICGENWFWHYASASWWSLYDLFRKVHFVFPYELRNNPMPKDHVTTLYAPHVNGKWLWQEFQPPPQAESLYATVIPTLNEEQRHAQA